VLFVGSKARYPFAIDFEARHLVRNTLDGVGYKCQNLLSQIQQSRPIWLWRVLQKFVDDCQKLLPNGQDCPCDGEAKNIRGNFDQPHGKSLFVRKQAM
jgi:hypothetical protein